jgi:hypothetical protein
LAGPTFTGVPAAPTAAVDTNTTQLATTAYVVGQGYLKSATASSTYAPLASPSLTGVPLAPTATAGTNTTQIATTAFVTAAVPAIASFAESQQLNSTTKVMSPFDVATAIMSEGYRPVLTYLSATSGTGASVGVTNSVFAQIVGPNASTAGYAYTKSESFNGLSTSSSSSNTVVFNKPIWISGTFDAFSSTYQGDANTETKVYLGTNMGNGDDPTAACIGWWKLGGASTPFNLMVHNGTTLTKVASASSTANSGQPFRWMVYSDGSGNVTLYINGVSVATTSAGPSGATQSATCTLTAAVKAGATATTRMVNDFIFPKIYVAPQ